MGKAVTLPSNLTEEQLEALRPPPPKGWTKPEEPKHPRGMSPAFIHIDDPAFDHSGVPRVYRKKPVMIDAIQFHGHSNSKQCLDFIKSGDAYPSKEKINGDIVLMISTLEGVMICSVGDYIIRGVNGEYYPCKPDIFHKTYEEV